MGGDTDGAAGFCAGLPRPVRVAYEAGPTGYGLARELIRRGVECVVAAPSKIPRGSGDRVKTDRRDAEHLVRLLMAGKLHPVRVPGAEEEALVIWSGPARRCGWTSCALVTGCQSCCCGTGSGSRTGMPGRSVTARGWLTVTLALPAAQATLLDARGAIDAPLTAATRSSVRSWRCCPTCPWATQIGRLRCLRGVDTLTAVGLCAGIGDFERFARAEQLMSYVGLVPASPRPVSSAGSARSPRPAPGTPDGCWSKRPGITAPGQASDSPDRPPSRPAPRGDRDLLVAQRRLHRTWTRLEARRARTSSPSPPPASRRVLLGDHPDRMNHEHPNSLSRRLGRWRPGTARGTRDPPMSNPPPSGLATPDTRQRLPTTNHGPAAPNPRISV